MIESLKQELRRVEEKIEWLNVNSDKREEYVKRKAAIERKIASLRGKTVVWKDENDSFPM